MITFSVDSIIVLFLIAGAIAGFKRGIIKSAVMFAGTILVLFLAFQLKNPVANLLYNFVPFFNFSGDFEGLTTLNLALYEGISFLLVYLVLICLLQILIKISGGIEKILDFTIILAIPSKLCGAIFGLLEAYLYVFICLFVLAQIPFCSVFLETSTLSSKILNETPIISKESQSYYESFKEIMSLKEDMKNKSEYNLKCLDILLKYQVVDKKTVTNLINSGKLVIPEANSVLNNYN